MKQSKESKKDPLERFGLDVSLMDPYIDPTREFGFTYVSQTMSGIPKAEVRTISNWQDERDTGDVKIVANQLEERLKKLLKNGFLPSGYPVDWNAEEYDKDLMRDIMRVTREYVDLQSDDWDSALAAWIIYTWMPELFPVLPRLLVQGVTNTGKSRIIDLVRLLCYRGLVTSDMTPAVMFRMGEWYRPTIAYDEAQDLVKNDLKITEILSLYKSGYDRHPIYRMNESGDVDVFNIGVPVAMAVKDWLPPEDCLNRSLIINMIKKRRQVSKDRPADSESFQELRGRLLAFRLQVLTDKVPIENFKQKAAEVVDGALELDGRTYVLEDRAAELARVLVVPSLIFGGSDEVLRVLLESEIKARDALLSRPEAQVFYALQSDLKLRIKDGEWEWKSDRANPDRSILVPGPKAKRRYAYVEDVREILLGDLRQQGDFDEKKAPNVGLVTRRLKALGFTIERGTGNKSTISAKTFPEVYLANLSSYGERQRDEGEPSPAEARGFFEVESFGKE